MLKQLTLCLMLLQMLVGQCQKGCLRCKNKSTTDTTKTCTLCDIANKYYLKEDGTCALSDLTNCTLMTHANLCVMCASGYRGDTGKCVAVDTAKKVINCDLYDTASNCMKCLSGYFLATNVCTKVTTPIANCGIQSTQELCSACSAGYFPASDSKSCKKLPTDCLGYNTSECKTCQPNYLLNKNYWKTFVYKFDTNNSRDQIVGLAIASSQAVSSLIMTQVCQPITVQYCQTYQTFDKCSGCIAGYYLDSKKLCQKFPEPVITNCDVYSYLSANKWQYQCMQCVQGTFLENNKSCKQIVAITGCLLYSTTASTTQCTACSTDKYLTNNTCTARTVVLTACAAPVISEEKCSSCGTGKVLSSDFQLCLNAISNCTNHGAFDKSVLQANLTCTLCGAGYYIAADAKSCVKGTKSNCAVYATSADTCTTCVNQFYPVPDCANQHRAVPECTLYSQTNARVCSSCTNKFTPVQIAKRCESIGAAILNCKTYNLSSAACTACLDGFFLSGGACVALQSNCITGSSATVCTGCKTGYYLATNVATGAKDCVLPPAFITEDCATYTQNDNAFTATSASSCTVCAESKTVTSSTLTQRCVSVNTLLYYFATPANLTSQTNCAVFKADGTCSVCKEATFWQANACLATCTNPIVPIDMTNGFQRNKCLTSAETTALATNDKKAIIRGQSLVSQNIVNFTCSFISVFANSVEYTNLNVYNTTNKDWVLHPADYHGALNCPDYAAGTYNNVTKNTNDLVIPTGRDREIWFGSVPNIFYKIACGWGKPGVPTTSSFSDGTYTYLACDASQNTTDFDVSTIYYGVSGYWSNLFNVHKCNATDHIPVIGVKLTTGSFSTLGLFGFAATTEWALAATKSKNIFCLNNSTAATIKTQLGLVAQTTVALTNCALGVLDLLKTQAAFDNSDYSTTDPAKISLICASCKPGFKPTAIVSNRHQNCVAITNCNTTSTKNNVLNACGQCSDNYTWQYDNANNKVLYNSCVQIPTTLKNCLAYNATEPGVNTKGTCKICDKGYYLNSDNFCELITIKNCSSFQQVVQGSPPTDIQQYLYQNGTECQSCSSEFINLIFANARNFCYTGNYFTASNNALSTLTSEVARTPSNLIQYCLQYLIGNLCNKCATNYILNASSKKCIEKNSTNKTLNCITSNEDGNNCLTCEANYGLTASGCVLGATSSCKTYNVSDSQNGAICQSCNNEYFKNNENACIKGKIPNCQVYSSENVCLTCAANFWPMQLSGSSNTARYCFPVDTSLNCNSVVFTNTNNLLTMSCTDSCTQPNMQNKDQLNTTQAVEATKCQLIPAVEFCETYNNTQINLEGGSIWSFTCATCLREYYLSSNDNNYKCIKRVSLDDNCETYSSTTDNCIKCKSSYYIDSTNKICLKYPTGIYGCTTYDNDLKCTDCDTNHFLSNNACTLVAADKRLTRCDVYKTATECKTCESGYFLTNATTCDLITIQFCKVFDAKDSCRTCMDGYAIKTTNAKNTCELVTVSFCSVVDVSTKKCSICNKDYYLNGDGGCTKASPVIANCEQMANDTTCKRCSINYALSIDLKTCVTDSGVESGCYDSFQSSSYSCSICKAGYEFVGSVCVKYGKATIDDGCFEQAADESCEFCISGWSMGTDGKCTNNNPPTTPTTKSSWLMKSCTVLLMFLFI